MPPKGNIEQGIGEVKEEIEEIGREYFPTDRDLGRQAHNGNVRLAPFLLLVAVVVACGSPALTPASLRAPAATVAADTEEISLEISALM